MSASGGNEVETDSMAYFASAFKTLTGHEPMPWQTRLFCAHFLSGNLPSAVSIPTGLGKTAVMAIWLVALAWQRRLNRSPVLARRLVYVVDRRAVVDQSTDFAEELRKRLAAPEATELRANLGLGDEQKLAISTLRGQFVDNRDWLEDPSRPAIVVGTVDMIGSRLLFEGYGVSRKMRPYHAGLLGADALVVLDEAHLVPPFEALLATIATEQQVYGSRSLDDRKRIPAFKLLPLSATNRSSGEAVFALETQDYVEPGDEGAKLTRKRLESVKRLNIETDGPKNLPTAIVERAWKIADDGKASVRCLIYCDKRDDAQQVHDGLLKKAKSLRQPRPEVELFVGARRVYERQEAQKRLDELGFLADSTSKPGRATFLVATSAGEVGVDLDADHMVCDLVPWERMVQRFGRVNRRGETSSDIVIVAPAPKAPATELPEKPQLEILIEPSKPIKPKRPGKKATPEERQALDEAPSRFVRAEATFKQASEHFKDAKKKQTKAEGEYREALKKHHEDWALTNGFNQRIDLLKRLEGDASPKALLRLLAEAAVDSDLMSAISSCCTPAPLRPALSRPLVDAWSMTSLEVHTGRPRIEPWLRGWVDELPQTVVAWREHLPARENPTTNKKEIEDFFEAAPVHAAERLETETFRLLDWLRYRVSRLRDRRAMPTSEAPTEEESLCEKTPSDGEAEEGTNLVENEEAAPAPVDVDDAPQAANAAGPKLRPDDILGIILSAAGDYQNTLLARDIPSQEKPDSAAQKKQHDAVVKRLKRELFGATLVLRADLGGLGSGLLKKESDAPVSAADGGAGWAKDDSGKPLIPFRVRESITPDAPTGGEWREAFHFALERNADGETTRWLIVDEWPDSSNTEDRRASGPEQLLSEHQAWAERSAQRLGERLGLDAAHLDMLAIAARLHDEGKKAGRWQNAFRARRNGRPYAKTKGPIDFKLLDGYRHEFGSLPYAQRDAAFQKLPPDLQDLALHLIAAHHGFARPVIATDGCEDAPPSALEGRAREVALRYARLQRRWGPWGLAWWEALLRAADQQASRANDARGHKPKKEAGQ